MATLPPEQADEPPPKLNVLALPSYTAVLFALIALVVLGAALASILPNSRLWWPPFLLGLTLLPLRDFLHRPDYRMEKAGLIQRQDETTEILSNELAQLTVRAPGVTSSGAEDSSSSDHPGRQPQLPALVTTSKPFGISAFGTFRRHYIGFDERKGVAMAHALGNPTSKNHQGFRAILAHELAHVLNHDVWLMWLSYGLLKMMILAPVLNLWVTIVLSIFIVEVSPEVLRPQFWKDLSDFCAGLLPGLPRVDFTSMLDSIRQQNSSAIAQLADPNQNMAYLASSLLYQISAHLPFLFAGGVLLALLWPYLLRVRELYADARAAQVLGNWIPVRDALVLAGIEAMTPEPQPAGSQVAERIRSVVFEWLARSLFSTHPKPTTRLQCLHKPQGVFGTWPKIALVTGLAVVLLDLILRGALTASYIPEPGAYLPILAGFSVFAVWWLPHLCLGNEEAARFHSQTVRMVLLYTGIVLLPRVLDCLLVAMMLLINPTQWGVLLDLYAYSLVGVSGFDMPRILGVEVTWGLFVDLHLVRPILYQALLMPSLLIATLWGYARVVREGLTWYRLAEGVRRLFFGIIAAFCVLLIFVAVPLSTLPIFPEIYTPAMLTILIEVVIALAILAILGVFFVIYHRRLARRCPTCHVNVPGAYAIGERCSQGHPLHRWLWANY